MAAREDLYRVLGVPRDADADAIRKAYRERARRYHPDVNPDDAASEAQFKRVSEAHAVLSDPERRRNYDDFGEISLEAGFDAAEARRTREAFRRHSGLDDLVSDFFGRREWGEAGGPRRGPDLEAELELDFLDAARGGEHRLTLSRPGAGGMRRETVTVRIPPGVGDGGRIRVPGKGGEGARGGAPGDLHARIRVRPHPFFRRSGRDLIFDLPLSVREATLGTRVRVPTLEGPVTLKVPPGTDSGARLRLRGKGMPHPGGGTPGDLYAVVQIRVPRKLPPDVAAQLEELGPYDPPDLRKDLE